VHSPRADRADRTSLLDLHPRELDCFNPKSFLTASQNRYTPILYQTWLFFGSRSRCFQFPATHHPTPHSRIPTAIYPPSEPAFSWTIHESDRSRRMDTFPVDRLRILTCGRCDKTVFLPLLSFFLCTLFAQVSLIVRLVLSITGLWIRYLTPSTACMH